MTGTEAFSVISAIVSTILAVFAIWLSVVFYRLSNESSAQIKESADRISASVDRLELVFNKLYADTFSMMRETVTDMRKHIWKSDPTSSVSVAEQDDPTQGHFVAVQQRYEAEIGRLLERQSSTDTQLVELREQLSKVLEKAMNETRESQDIPLREFVQTQLRKWAKRGKCGSLEQLLQVIPRTWGERDLVDVLFQLRKEGVIVWPGPESRLATDDEISLAVEKTN